jgi:inward rectifier potassium channel
MAADPYRSGSTQGPGASRLGTNTIRKGAPGTPLTDLYYNLLKASWTRVIGLFALVFLAVNLAFALLYVVGGDCLTGVTPGHFPSCFFFSIQTITTIGYGAMSPKTPYAHVIVSVESFVGLVMIAVATGLIFAKFARPRAKFIFSDNLLITNYAGKRCVLFRVANARGNDVVEASMKVVVLKPEVTPEGHHLRRLHDLKLQRADTPLFMLSWLVVHEIDEESPLFGVTVDDMERDSMLIIVSLKGLDGTFAQDIYGRHLYHPQDVLLDHRFTDVITIRPDGTLVFDMSLFHGVQRDVEHDGAALDDENLDHGYEGLESAASQVHGDALARDDGTPRV